MWMTSLIRRAVAIEADLASTIRLAAKKGKEEQEMEDEQEVEDSGYFGLCPLCKKTDGYLNIGRNHWYTCHEHQVRWLIGENVFSDWRDETESEQRRRCKEIGFDSFMDVEPFYPNADEIQRRLDEDNIKVDKEAFAERRSKISRSLVADAQRRDKKRD
jgi:hypothetical protein